MIRFVDMRGQDTGYQFAFWDTTLGRFCEFCNRQAWGTKSGFVADFYQAGGRYVDAVRASVIERFTSLMPEWTNLEWKDFEWEDVEDKKIVDGWYVIHYCFDAGEGSFINVARLNIDSANALRLPIFEVLGPYFSEDDAQKAAHENESRAS